MNVWNLTNYLLGYVTFSVTGTGCEAFLNEVMKNNLDVWAIKRTDAVTVFAKTRMVGFKEVQKAAEASHTELKKHGEKGLPKILLRYRFRYGMMAGACVFVLLVAALSLFVWNIDIVGTQSIYERDRVLEILEQNGFSVGSFIPTQNKGAIKRRLMQEFSSIAGVTVNIFGTKAVVEISPAVIPPENVTVGAKCNIVAKTDGQLVLVEAYRGLAEVKVGQVVKKGQLLISGVYNSKRVGQRPVHARGKVLARTLKTLEKTVLFSESESPEADARAFLDEQERLGMKNTQIETRGERVIKNEQEVTVVYFYTVIEDIGESLEIYIGEQ